MVVAGVGLVALTALAQPARRGPAIKFSEPKNESVSTNLNPYADTIRNNLRQLEEGVSPRIGVFNQAEIETIARPVLRPPPVIQSKRVRELLDRQKNWVFISPEEQATELTEEEMMGVTLLDEQGQKKTSISPLEKYYQNLDRAQAGGTNQLSNGRGTRSDDEGWLSRGEGGEGGEGSFNPVQDRLQETERGLQSLLKTDTGSKFFTENPQIGSMPDLFAPPRVGKTSEEKAQELRSDQFRQMMQPDYSRPGGFPGVPSVGSTAGFATPGAVLKPVTLPGVGSLTGAGLAGAPAVLETKPPSVAPLNPVRTQFPSPMSELPRRKF
jgi:hypothetical protein